MIKEITTGSLGNTLKDERYELYSTDDIDKLCSYGNDKLTIYFNQKGFGSKYNTMHFLYNVYNDREFKL